MKTSSRKLELRRETLVPIDGGVPPGGAPSGGAPGGVRASSGACLRAGAYSIASAATAISSYFLTRGC